MLLYSSYNRASARGMKSTISYISWMMPSHFSEEDNIPKPTRVYVVQGQVFHVSMWAYPNPPRSIVCCPLLSSEAMVAIALVQSTGYSVKRMMAKAYIRSHDQRCVSMHVYSCIMYKCAFPHACVCIYVPMCAWACVTSVVTDCIFMCWVNVLLLSRIL